MSLFRRVIWRILCGRTVREALDLSAIMVVYSEERGRPPIAWPGAPTLWCCWTMV